MLSKTEILAPAGNMDAVRAAVNGHADAVYLGGSLFSARAFAGNFDEKELLETIDYCHTFDVKVYMAVNTLLKNDEIKRLPDYLEPYYREGVDGIIVQDMGVAGAISGCFPDLPLHGSTQLSVSSEYGAAFLKSIGMTRFVPSRELSLDEIRSIKSKIDIEVETFVHGAMCYCYSGRCLMSSYAGGRSGNRGRCAQPCRKRYQLEDQRAYMLSLKDMCMLSDIGRLIDAGIDSFKIEGRMKKPEYVAATSYVYSELRDEYLSGCKNLSRQAAKYENMLRDIYNRGGFCSGYYFTGNGRQMMADDRPNHTGVKVGKVSEIQKPYINIKLSTDVHPGDIIEIRGRQGDVELTCGAEGSAGKSVRLKGKLFQNIAVGSQVYRTRNNALLNDIQKNIIERDRKVQLKADVRAKIGEKMSLSLSLGSMKVYAEGSECIAALNKPVTESQIIEKIRKTGGTQFEITDVTSDIDEGIFAQISAINNLRRQSLEDMKDLLINCKKRNPRDARNTEDIYRNVSERKKWSDRHPGITVLASTAEHVNIIKNYKWVSNVIVDYNIKQYGGELKEQGFKVFIALPEVLRQRKLKTYSDMTAAINEFDGVMIRNMDELGYIIENGYSGPVIADAGLYVYNDIACDFYREHTEDVSFVASQELTLDEIKNLSVEPALKIYGHQKVMVTANCISGNYKHGCADKKMDGTGDVLRLTDDIGNVFYVRNYCSDCYNVLYNGVPASLLDEGDELNDIMDDCYIEFTIENADMVKNIMDHIGKNILGQELPDGRDTVKNPVKDYTRGHYYKGID